MTNLILRSNFARPSAALFGLAIALQGCTTHLVTKGDPGTGAFTEGAAYRLPINQFEIDVTWQISSCVLVRKNPDDKVIDIKVGFKQLAKITSEMGEGEALVIDYQKLTGPFKTGKLDIEYWTIGEGKDARPTMLVKSINSEIEGHEAEAIKAAAGAIGSIAKFALTASGVPGPDSGTGTLKDGAKKTVACNNDVLTAIQQIDDNDKMLKSIAKQIDKLTLQVTLISGRVVGGKLTTEDDKKLGETQSAMDQLTDQTENLVKSTEKLKAMLTYKQSYPLPEFDWPKEEVHPVAKLTKELSPDAGKLAELALMAVDFDEDWCKNDPNPCKPIEDELRSNANREKVVATLDATGFGNTGFTPAFSKMTPEMIKKASFNGFVYREPVPARITVASNDGEVISGLATSAPQYGRVRVLSLRSRFAEKNGLSVQLAQNGMPTKVTYNAYQAGGTAVFESTKALFDEANTVADRNAADKKAKDDEVKGAELQAVKDKIALLTEQQKLAVLEKEPDAEIAAREAELAQLRYEVERMELLAKLNRSND